MTQIKIHLHIIKIKNGSSNDIEVFVKGSVKTTSTNFQKYLHYRSRGYNLYKANFVSVRSTD